MTKSKAAFLYAAEHLGAAHSLFLWTFTFKEVLDVVETRKRWNHLLTLLKRQWPDLQGLRVFEMHREHGLHIHLLTNRFIDVVVARRLAQLAGWGRIHVKRTPKERAGYLAKYLSKDRPPCLKGWRLWAGFGKDWDWTKVKDIACETITTRIYQACKEAYGWTGRKGFFDRMRLVRFLVMRTIVEDWKDGFGPNDKPYWMCSSEELLGSAIAFDAPF